MRRALIDAFARARLGWAAFAGAAALAGALAPTQANALAFYQNYLVRPAFDVGAIVLYQRTATGGGTTNSFDAFAPSTLITDPFLKTEAITGTYFLGVTTLGDAEEDAEAHLVLALDDAFAGGLVSGGLDFADIFTGYSEADVIDAATVLATGGHTQEEIDAAATLIFEFSDDVADLGGLFGSVDTFTMVAFSTASPFGDGESFVTGAAPEPSTWGLMILGFGAAGAVLRRRARAAFAAG